MIGTIVFILTLLGWFVSAFSNLALAYNPIREEGTVKIFIDSPEDVRLSASLVLFNQSSQRVSVDKFSVSFPFFKLVDFKVSGVNKQNVLIDTFAEYGSTAFRIKSSKKWPVVLKPKEELRFKFSAKVKGWIVSHNKGVYYALFPPIKSPFKFIVYLNNQEYEPLLGKLESKYDKYVAISTDPLKSSSIWFVSKDVSRLTVEYSFRTQAGYFYPGKVSSCEQAYLNFADSYFYRDKFGFLSPSASVGVISRHLDLECFKGAESLALPNLYFKGFFIDPASGMVRNVVFRYGVLGVEEYDSGRFVFSPDKYGVFHVPFVSCNKVQECLEATASGSQVSDFKIKPGASEFFNCRLTDLGLKIENLKLRNHEVLVNTSNDCMVVKDIVCNPFRILQDREVVIMPQQGFRLPNKCTTGLYVGNNRVKDYQAPSKMEDLLPSIGVYFIGLGIILLLPLAEESGKVN